MSKEIVEILREISYKKAEIVDQTPFDIFEDNLALQVIEERLQSIYSLIESNPDLTREYVEEAILPIQDQLDNIEQKINQLLPEKPKKRNILPLRDPVYTDLFKVFFNAAGSSYKRQKDLKIAQLQIAYTILFYVGIRVNEMRFFTQKDIENAISTSQFNIPGYLEVNENCKITDWQAAKHIYHANGMGIDPAEYGFTQQELLKIRGESRYKGGGLIAYARRGYRLPPIEMIQDYQLRLKTSCNKAPIKRTNVPYYDVNGAWQAKVFATPPSEYSSGIIIAFNESTGDLITGDKQKTAAFNRFKDENYLGGKKLMLKWSNK